MLNSIPLFTAILGALFLAAMLFNPGILRNSKQARVVWVIIMVLAIHAQVDAWLFYNEINTIWEGLSLLHYHLMGGLFLLFAYYLFRLDIGLRPWLWGLGGYTVLRILFLIPEDAAAYENYSENLGWVDVGILLDYFISNALNIACIWVALVKVKALPLVLKPQRTERLSMRWLKSLLWFQIGLYVALAILAVASFFFYEQWLTFWKIDSMLSGFFFFVLAFFALRFPIFSVYGDFKDLGTEEKKYAKSSLSGDGSKELFRTLVEVVEKEKLYLNPALRLNDVAERMEESVHHISQVINQELGQSFSDFVNGYRITEAQQLLKSDRAKQLTILAIALEAGFNSKTAFYNAFKKATGQTPSQYIKAQQ